MDVLTFTTHHLVKSEDLNHHGTLFAGRNAEWFVEAGFIAAAGLVPPENVVCLKIHGMSFTRPVHLGEIVHFESKIIFTGRTRMVASIRMNVKGAEVVHGFITFIHVDAQGHPQPHGILIEPASPEDVALQEKAKQLSITD